MLDGVMEELQRIRGDKVESAEGSDGFWRGGFCGVVAVRISTLNSTIESNYIEEKESRWSD